MLKLYSSPFCPIHALKLSDCFSSTISAECTQEQIHYSTLKNNSVCAADIYDLE